METRSYDEHESINVKWCSLCLRDRAASERLDRSVE